jgi:methyl-accepting chemotaxis protein
VTENPWQPWTRAQAAALRAVNAPIVAALEQQREAAESLAALAEQMATMAEQVGRMARQQAEVTRQMQAAMKPYRDLLDWLDGGR